MSRKINANGKIPMTLVAVCVVVQERNFHQYDNTFAYLHSLQLHHTSKSMSFLSETAVIAGVSAVVGATLAAAGLDMEEVAKRTTTMVIAFTLSHVAAKAWFQSQHQEIQSSQESVFADDDEAYDNDDDDVLTDISEEDEQAQHYDEQEYPDGDEDEDEDDGEYDGGADGQYEYDTPPPVATTWTSTVTMDSDDGQDDTVVLYEPEPEPRGPNVSSASASASDTTSPLNKSGVHIEEHSDDMAVEFVTSTAKTKSSSSGSSEDSESSHTTTVQSDAEFSVE